MIRWVVAPVVIAIALALGVGAWFAVPVYQEVSLFTDVLADAAEKARSARTPDEEVRQHLMDEARHRGFELPSDKLTIDHPEPGSIHIRALLIRRPFPNRNFTFNMNLETRRP